MANGDKVFPGFLGAGPGEMSARKRQAEQSIKKWVKDFESKKDLVKKKSNGRYDVRGDLDLSKDKIFDEWYLTPSLIQRYIRFNKINGNFTARAREFILVLPRIVEGDIHIVWNYKESIDMAGCKVNGKIVVTLEV